MTFKSKVELFGDNGAHGLQVPISTSNPPGTAAANRGIGFGEAVTAAIANRLGAALADNTDDLNTRLGTVETGGLNASYRGGSLATPGIGRQVTIDGGAIEAIGNAANTDAMSALYRATMQSSGADIGFDAEGFGVAFQQRNLQNFASNTILSSSGVSAVLNPAGAGIDVVEIAGGNRFANSGATDLCIGQDLLVITGAGAQNGVFWIVAVLTDFRVQVSRVLGATNFPTTTSATVKVERISFREGVGSLSLLPTPAATGVQVMVPATAPGNFLEGWRYATTGAETKVYEVDPYAGVHQTWDNGLLSAANAADPTKAASYIDARTSAVDTRPVIGSAKNYPNLGIIEYLGSGTRRVLDVRYSDSQVSGFGYTIPATVTLLAGTANVECPVANNFVGLLRTMHIVRLSGTSGGTFDGYYAITGLDPNTGNGRFSLMKLDGTTPSFTAGTGTLEAKYTYSSQSGSLLAVPGGDFTLTASTKRGKTLTGGSVGLKIANYAYGDAHVDGSFIVARKQTYTPEDTSNLHAYEPDFMVVGNNAYAKNLYVYDSSGSYGNLVASRVTESPIFSFGQYLGLFTAPTQVLRPTAARWTANWAESLTTPGNFTDSAAGATIYFDFAFPYYMTVVGIYARVTPSAARTGTNRVTVNADYNYIDQTGALVSNSTYGPYYDDGTTGSQAVGSASMSLDVDPTYKLRVSVKGGQATAPYADVVEQVFLLVKSRRIQ